MTELHKLAARQVRKAIGADGNVDIARLIELVSAAYHDIDADRRRSDRAMNIMVDELRAFNGQLEGLVESRTRQVEILQQQMRNAVDNMHHGMLMIDKDRRLVVCNKRALSLLKMPPEVLKRPESFRETFAARLERGEFQGADPAFVRWMLGGPIADVPLAYTRTFSNGNCLLIHHVPLPDGSAVRTFIDITERERKESALKLAEAEYRGLFENAVLGIYRATPDGKLLRANPALLKLFGFTSEEEMVGSSFNIFDTLFADRPRRAEFLDRMCEHGRVTDFIARARGARPNETLWISQNAWAISDADGAILFYEGALLDSSERKAAEARIAHLAQHDGLTGLANRTLFQQKLDVVVQQAAAGKPAALYCLDLDRFKEVNDALGHGAGDLLLLAVARRLRSCIRGDDMVARLGGDEFAIIQTEVDDRAAIAATAKRIVESLSAPFRIGRHRVQIGVSIGIVTTPRDGVSPGDLLRNADLALYRAKADGTGSVEFFKAEMATRLHERAALQADLKLAIEHNELRLHYQPQVKMTGEVKGFEALTRWHCPKRGMVPPSEFIPLAEESSLILALGEWVLREACREAASWEKPLKIAVNVSPVQFRHGDLPRLVHSILLETGLAANRLELEITEGVLIGDFSRAVSILRRLKSYGVQIALDDFGKGYSSLSYLHKFPFDKIKIDRSFILDIGTNQQSIAIVHAVIGLGRSLNIPILAEGVETKSQYDFLAKEGCSEVQGYLTGKPLAISEYTDIIGRKPDAQPKRADWFHCHRHATLSPCRHRGSIDQSHHRRI